MENEKSLMSRLYEMQDSYAFEQTSIDNTIPHCIIDTNKRTITVPEEIKSLGVQYDHRSNIVVFEIDRYIDEVDLLTQTCIIQWVNSDNSKENMGFYPVTMIDSSVEGKLIFTWEIYNESTQLPGAIYFAVRFYSMQDENSFLWSFNTLPAQSVILDTLDVVVKGTADIEPSILMAWTEQMSQLEQIARDAINFSSQSAKEAEAWAHGRSDFPATMLDNSKYYKDLTKSIYDDAKDEITNKKTEIIEAISGISNQEIEKMNVAKQKVVTELENKKQEIIEASDSGIENMNAVKQEVLADLEDSKNKVLDSIPEDYTYLAKAVEDAVNNKVPFPSSDAGNNYGSINQILCSNGYGGTKWVDFIKDFNRVEFDSETRYLRFLDVNGNDVYDPVYIEGGGSGGSSTTSDVKLVNNLDSTFLNVAYGDSLKLSFNFTSTDNGISTGDGICQIIVNGITCSTFSIKQGDTEIDITNYLSIGTNTVRIKCSDVYGGYKLLNYSVSVIDLRITSIFDDTITYSDIVPYKFTLYGEIEKTVHIIFNETEVYTNTTSLTNRQTTVNLQAPGHGVYTLDAYVTATINDKDIESDHLVCDIMFVESDKTDVLLASAYNIEEVSQGDLISIPYSVYNPNSLNSEVVLTIYSDDDVYSTNIIEVDRTRQYWNVRKYPIGNVIFSIKCGEKEKRHTVNVKESDIILEHITNDLELYLSSSGRNNNEINPDTWTYNEITTSFENVNWSSTGWIYDENGDPTLRLSGGSIATIDFKPFENDWKTYGKTIEFEFAVRDVNNRNAVIISCMNEGIGFEFTADSAILKSQQSEISCNYCDEDRIKISFVVEAKNEHRLMQIYMNGILSGAIQYPASDTFQQTTPVNITIGSEDCVIDLYTVRSYTNALTFNDIINNYIYDLSDIGQKSILYNENNIYNEYGVLQYNLIKQKIPVMTIIGNLPQTKGDKKNVKIIFEHNETPSLNYEDTAEIDVQGTSSQFFIRKNYKGETSAIHQHAIGQMPSTVFCTKADYAESTGTHNTQNANLVETLYSQKTPAQIKDPRCRTTIYGYPIVIFHQETSSSTPVFIGKYNYNFDKGSVEAFGFDGTFDVESWEFKNNTSNQCNFLEEVTEENWSENFEARYPDKYSDISRFKVMHDWVVSTKGNVEKFRNEFETYFDLHYSLIYYVYTSVMLMVDQRAKNMFLTYWADTGKWQPWFYDNDTCLGINNEGHLVFDYYHEDIDQLNGANVYNGQNSTLWSNFREAYADEIKECYQNLRNNDRLTYEKILEYFIDNGSRKWSASIYNEDSDYKYISMLRNSNDATNLYQIRGNGEGHLKYFIKNRINYLDSKWYASDYADNLIALRIYTPSEYGSITPNANITITPFSDMYAGVRYKANGTLYQERAEKNVPVTFIAPNETFNDTETAIYGASEISSLGDLAPLYCGSINVSKASKLVVLKIGDSSSDYSNGNLTELSVGTNRLLKKLDISNCPNLVDPIDLSGCPNIEEIYARGCGITGIQLSNGGYLKVLHLPETIANLTLIDQKYITDLTIDGYDNITTLNIQNCPTVNTIEIFNKAKNLKRVRLINVELSFANANYMLELAEKGLKGIDEYGENIDTIQISGNCHINFIKGTELDRLQNYYPYLNFTYDTIAVNMIFMNDDGTEVLYNGEYNSPIEITDPVKSGAIETPTKETTAQYTYSYTGWSTTPGGVADNKAFIGITAGRTLYAAFDATIRSYTIKFTNFGTVVQSGIYEYGQIPEYIGNELVHNTFPDEYAFDCWEPEIVPVTGEATYDATYKFIGSYTRKYLSDDIEELNDDVIPGLTSIGSRAFSYRTLSYSSYVPKLKSVKLNSCVSVGSYAFYNDLSLTSVDLPECTYLGGYAFYKCTSLESISLPKCTEVYSYAFDSTALLTTLSLPQLVHAGNRAFSNMTSVTSIELPLCETLGSEAFYGSKKLTSINLPSCTTFMGTSTFNGCSGLVSANLPVVSELNSNDFWQCPSLESVYAPNCTKLNSNVFNACSSLKQVNLDNCVTTSNSVFASCTSLESISLPKCTTLGATAFSGCTSLKRVELSSCNSLGSNAFSNCSSLEELILRGSSMCSLGSSTLSTSGIASGTGYVYVPKTLVEDYKANSSWNTYASQIRAIEDYPEICS